MNVDYSKYYYRQKAAKKQSKLHIWLSIFLIAACFSVFFIVYPKSHNQTYLRAVKSKGHVEVYEQFFYAVEIGRFQSEGSAVAFADNIKSMGGGGYIIIESDTFFVLTSLYQKESDASAVAHKNKNSGYNALVYPIAIPHSYIKATRALDSLAETLGYTFDFLLILEKLSYNLDVKKYNLKNGLDELVKQRNNITNLMSDFDSAGINTVANTEIRTFYMNIVARLDEIKTSADDEKQLSVEVRWLSLDCINKFSALLKAIS